MQRSGLSKLKLIHWNAAEVAEKAASLEAAGYAVDARPMEPAHLREMRADPPRAVVIDLSRLPSQSRDIAVALRASKGTRHLPLVFVGGEPEKVEKIKELLLTGATYTTWPGVIPVLKEAIVAADASAPPAASGAPSSKPAAVKSVFAARAGVRLVDKLGIKAHTNVGLIGAPDGFEAKLAPLPEGAVLSRTMEHPYDLVLWFPTSRQDLEETIRRMGAVAGRGGLWVVWPKASSNAACDITQPFVRRVGLAAGLVDHKVAVIDAVWTGLRFAHRERSSRE